MTPARACLSGRPAPRRHTTRLTNLRAGDLLGVRSAEPFKQGRFEELPLRPRVPHRYDDADGEQVVVESAPFGRIRVHVASYGPRDAPPLLLIHGL